MQAAILADAKATTTNGGCNACQQRSSGSGRARGGRMAAKSDGARRSPPQRGSADIGAAPGFLAATAAAATAGAARRWRSPSR